MNKTHPYFLVISFGISFYPLLAQEVQYNYGCEKPEIEVSTLNFQSEAKELKQKTFEVFDELSIKPANILTNTKDSLDNLSIKVQAKIDSLQRKLEDFHEAGNRQLSKANQKSQRITQRIDSLQNLLKNKIRFDKLNQYSNEISGEGVVNQLNGLNLLDLEKLSIPVLPDLNTDKLDFSNLSLPNNGLTSLTSNVNQQLQQIGGLNTNDWIKADLPDYKNILKGAGQYSELLKDPSKIDQTVDAQAGQLSEFQNLKEQTQELTALKELPESLLADLKRFEDQEALKAEAKNQVVEQATNYFAGHEDKLTEAQGTLTKLKKKYSYVPDSRDLSTAIKANSLKREPLKKRFVLGLGFQLHRTNPISLDLSPNLLYRFNKLFSAGLSGIYRESLGIENNTMTAPNTTQDVYGASAIAQHKVWKGFFAHGEFQYLSTPLPDQTGADQTSRAWNEGIPIGIGKQINFSEALRGQIIFTYDFLHDQYSPNPKAWNLKFGFQFGKIRLKDIKF